MWRAFMLMVGVLFIGSMQSFGASASSPSAFSDALFDPIPAVTTPVANGPTVPAGAMVLAAIVTEDASLTVTRSKWQAKLDRMLLQGTAVVATGDQNLVFYGTNDGAALDGGLNISNKTTSGGFVSFTWKFLAGNLGVVPCEVRISAPSGTPSAVVPLANAPKDCAAPGGGGGNTALNCSVVSPLDSVIALNAGESAYFEGKASGGNGQALSYVWDFGGAASNSTSRTPGFVSFQIPGNYDIQFVATDGQDVCKAPIIAADIAPTGSEPPSPVAEQPFIQGNQYRVFANNDLGMHCADLGTAPFSVLPPFNILNATLIQRGNRPRIIAPGTPEFEVRYSASSNPNDPHGAGSINSTSSNWPVGANSTAAQIRKSDFWDKVGGTSYAKILYGIDLGIDEGLIFGQYMPGNADPYNANTPQPFQTHPWLGVYSALGIPITPYDDSGRHNPYPLMRVQAMNAQTGAILSSVDSVVPVSDELNCQACHVRGSVAADPSARSVDLDFAEPVNPNDRVSVETAAKYNILLLHDFKHGSAYNPPLAERTTVLCASCHNSPALSEVGGPAGDPAREMNSRVIHGFHGQLVVDAQTGKLVRDSNGNPILQPTVQNGQVRLIRVDINDPDIPMEENCFLCHPGKNTQCFRGVMRTAGLQCANCHGDMVSVGGVFDLSSGPNAGEKRHPWFDEPRCESCHVGEAKALTVAYEAGDPSAAPRMAADKRFAEMPGTLYRNSTGHGELLCETCHGSPHAVWPLADPNANDNVASTQIQGHAGLISECTVCHTSIPNQGITLKGPHGMHPVGNTKFAEEHAGLFERNPNACADCHGANLQGTRLSKTFVERRLKSDREVNGSKTIVLVKGTEVSCTLCHEDPR